MTLSSEQIGALSAPLSKSNVKARKQAGREVSYIESWHAESEANRIFGFDGWDSLIQDLRLVSEREVTIGKGGQYEKPGWSVSYICTVRVPIWNGERMVLRDGVGAGHGIDADLGQAHESAVKEAASDAEKRALKTWGNQFGLALYDKTQANVANDPPPPGPLEAIAQEHGGRLSSAEAKRRGEDTKIKAEIAALDVPGLGNWMARFDENTAHLPRAWLDSIRDFAEGHLAELQKPPEAEEMDEAFRATMGSPRSEPVAGRPRDVAA